jgi:hypothetical protein
LIVGLAEFVVFDLHCPTPAELLGLVRRPCHSQKRPTSGLPYD